MYSYFATDPHFPATITTTITTTSLYRLTKEVSSGSCVVNDCLYQFANLYAPFGGVGESGMGGYHGKIRMALLYVAVCCCMLLWFMLRCRQLSDMIWISALCTVFYLQSLKHPLTHFISLSFLSLLTTNSFIMYLYHILYIL